MRARGLGLLTARRCGPAMLRDLPRKLLELRAVQLKLLWACWRWRQGCSLRHQALGSLQQRTQNQFLLPDRRRRAATMLRAP